MDKLIGSIIVVAVVVYFCYLFVVRFFTVCCKNSKQRLSGFAQKNLNADLESVSCAIQWTKYLFEWIEWWIELY